MGKTYCKFTEKGIETFGKQKIGEILAESRNTISWRVLWKGLKTPHNYHKSFIKKIDSQEFQEFIKKEKEVSDKLVEIEIEYINSISAKPEELIEKINELISEVNELKKKNLLTSPK